MNCLLDREAYATTFNYDIYGNLVRVVDAEGYEIVREFDDRGNLVYDSSGMTGKTVFEYDEAGNLISRTDANSIEVTYEYDYMNRLLSADYPDDSLDVDYTYDLGTSINGKGLLSREVKDGVIIAYDYNEFGLVKRETQTYGSNSYSIYYDYNSDKNIIRILYPSGIKYYYNYDANGKIKQIQSKFGQGQLNTIIDSIYYEPFGDIKRIVYDNGVKTDFTYNNRYLLDGISTGTDLLVNRSYTYDTLGNIPSIYDSLQTGNELTTYSYDLLNQLTSASSGQFGSDDPMEYTYYKNGNRHLKIAGTDTTTYGYTANRLTSLSGAEDVSFGYDSVGNMTSIIENIAGDSTFSTLSYNQNNHLVSLTDSSTYAYFYNTRSQRYQTQYGSSTVRYIHSLDGMMLEDYVDGDWTFDYIYLYGKPIAKVWAENNYTGDTLVDTIITPPIESMSLNSIGDPPPSVTTDYVIYYYHNDHLGTPLALTDDNKTIMWGASYYPFGTLDSEFVSTSNNIRFPGQWHDRETDNHYNYHRFYSPRIGRYLTADPIGFKGGINYYSYVSNNPIISIDPYGLYSWVEFGYDVADIVVAFGDAASYGITRKIRNTDWYGGDCSVDYDSWAYALGYLLGEEVRSRVVPGIEAIGTVGIAALIGKSGSLKDGYDTFTKFKNAYGRAGNGMAWHHIVEATPSNVAKFGANNIHNINNMIKLPHGRGSIHNAVSAYYSSKKVFSEGQTVRKWLANKSFEEQFEFGIQVLNDFGVIR